MFTHRNKKGTNERGALIMEAIAMLGLMTMMSPMIVRQTADHQTEKEEVSVAGQMKTLKSALAAYIAANYDKLKDESNLEFSQDGLPNSQGKKTIKFSELMSYLPKGYMEYDSGSPYKGKLYGNKLFDSYKIGIRIEDAGEGAKNMIGLILSDHSSDDDDKWIDDRRAARIASMIGADGGYMRSSKTLSALGLAGDEKKKVIGTQGVWEIGDVGDFFSGVNGSAAYDARIAAITTYAGSVSGDFLYRMKEESLPGANSMFTDLDMGSNSGTGCTGPADRCNKITNAGGMEVINGNIVILSGANRSNTHLDVNPSAANIDVSNKIDFTAVNGAALRAGEYLKDGNTLYKTQLNLSETQAVLNADNSKLDLSATKAVLLVNNGRSKLDLNATQALLKANGGRSQLLLNDTTTVTNNVAYTDMIVLNVGNTKARFYDQKRDNKNAFELETSNTSHVYLSDHTQDNQSQSVVTVRLPFHDKDGTTGHSSAFYLGTMTNLSTNKIKGSRASFGPSDYLRSGNVKTNSSFELNWSEAVTTPADIPDIPMTHKAELKITEDDSDTRLTNRTLLNLTPDRVLLGRLQENTKTNPTTTTVYSQLNLGKTSALLNDGASKLNLTKTQAVLQANDGASKLDLDNANATLNAASTKLNMTATQAVLQTNNGYSMLNMGLFVNEEAKTKTDQAALNVGATRLELAEIVNKTSNAVIRRGALLKANNGASQLDLNDANATLNVGKTMLNINATSAQLLVNNGTDSKLHLNGANAVLSVSDGKTMLDMTATQALLKANNGASVLNMSSTVSEQTKTDQAFLNVGTTTFTLNSKTTGNTTLTSAELTSNSATLQGNISNAYLNTTIIPTIIGKNENHVIGLSVNNKGKFTLTQILTFNGEKVVETNRSLTFSINGGTVATNGSLTFDKNALTLTQNRAKIIFDSANSRIAAFSGKDGNRGNYLRLAKDGASTEANAPIAFYTESGRIAGSFFQPEKVAMSNNTVLVDPVRKQAQLQFVNDVTGQTKAFWIAANDPKDASVTIDASGDAYNLHGGDTAYKRFRVDPAFVSVMNDIKQTSRGGARLSEALPNYILKGVYTLTNSYSAGPWPCASDSDQSCIFTMPYYSKEQLGLTAGGQEFNCDGWSATTGSNSHPLYNTLANACKAEGSAGSGYVSFKYYNDSYQTCPNNRYCWAHPFMGKVPAPGYKVAVGDDAIYAHDEGVCPDGYVPVLTLTPDSFEIGRVLLYKPNNDIINAAVKYNVSGAGVVNFDDSDVREMAPMIQQGSWVGVYARRISNANDNGWQVAMGTATLTSNNNFKWNIAGIPANSWQLTAHTYCYFNPNRFTMPNMRFKKVDGTNAGADATDVILVPMRNADDTKTTGSD